MKIRTLMENTACCENLTAEHGLSLYIETGNRRILFDMGQSAAFVDNAILPSFPTGTTTTAADLPHSCAAMTARLFTSGAMPSVAITTARKNTSVWTNPCGITRG